MPYRHAYRRHTLFFLFVPSSLAFRCVRGERLLSSSLMSWVSGLGLLLSCSVVGTTRVWDTFTTPAATLASLRRHEVRTRSAMREGAALLRGSKWRYT